MRYNELPYFDAGQYELQSELLGFMLEDIKRTPGNSSILDLGCGSEYSYDNYLDEIYYPYLCLAAVDIGVPTVVGIDISDSDIGKNKFTFLNENLAEILKTGLSGYLHKQIRKNKFSIVHTRLLTEGRGSPQLNRTLGRRMGLQEFNDCLIEQARAVVEPGGILYWNGDKV